MHHTSRNGSHVKDIRKTKIINWFYIYVKQKQRDWLGFIQLRALLIYMQEIMCHIFVCKMEKWEKKREKLKKNTKEKRGTILQKGQCWVDRDNNKLGRMFVCIAFVLWYVY